MNSLHAPSFHVTRLVFGAIAAVALLAATSAAAASERITSDQFAPGWQDHAKSLFNLGMSRDPSRSKYLVPEILPTGEYVLVRRVGDKAELMDGYRFTIGAGNEKHYMLLDPGIGDVQALPVSDIPALKPRGVMSGR